MHAMFIRMSIWMLSSINSETQLTFIGGRGFAFPFRHSPERCAVESSGEPVDETQKTGFLGDRR